MLTQRPTTLVHSGPSLHAPQIDQAGDHWHTGTMPETHHREFSELPITVDRELDAPLPAQIAAALREAIDQHTLRPGEAVPASRELARRLGVARGVVVSAYEQLIAEGYLSASHGRGTRVHPELEGLEHSTHPQLTEQKPLSKTTVIAAHTPAGTRPLSPGLPDTSAVETQAWRQAWRSAASHAHLEAPELGDPLLRSEIAEHLRRMRGTAMAVMRATASRVRPPVVMATSSPDMRSPFVPSRLAGGAGAHNPAVCGGAAQCEDGLRTRRRPRSNSARRRLGVAFDRGVLGASAHTCRRRHPARRCLASRRRLSP